MYLYKQPESGDNKANKEIEMKNENQEQPAYVEYNTDKENKKYYKTWIIRNLSMAVLWATLAGGDLVCTLAVANGNHDIQKKADEMMDRSYIPNAKLLFGIDIVDTGALDKAIDLDYSKKSVWPWGLSTLGFAGAVAFNARKIRKNLQRI